MGSAEEPHLLDRGLPAERRDLNVIELELPRATAAPSVLSDPGARATVARGDFPAHLCRRPRGGAGWHRGARSLAARRDRSPPFPMLLDGAADGRVENGGEVAVRDLVGEKA